MLLDTPADELLLGLGVDICNGGWLLDAELAGCDSLISTDVAKKSSSLKTWRFGGCCHRCQVNASAKSPPICHVWMAHPYTFASTYLQPG